MSNLSNEIFLLTANLSQQKDKDRIIRLFIEGLNNFFENINFHWDEKASSNNLLEICTRKNSYGSIYCDAPGKLENHEMMLLQNATQMTAVFIERAEQEKLLGNKKNLLEEIVRDKTKELINSREEIKKVTAERQKYLEALVNAAPDAIVTLDSKHKILEWNKGSEKLFGYKKAEVLGKNIDNLITKEEKFKEAKNFTIQVLSGKEIKPRETIRYRKDGSPVNVIAAGSPIIVNNELIGVIAVYTDISKRKEAERALLKSEEKFRLAFRTSPESVNMNRASDGLYLDINEGFTKIMGYTRNDVIGKTSLELNIWDNPKDRAKLVKGLQENGVVENLEARFRAKNGSIKYGLMSARVIEIDNEMVILNITRDITDRKLLEIREQQLSSIDHAIIGKTGLKAMLEDILSKVVEIFDCDRAWLLNPADLRSTHYDIPFIRCKEKWNLQPGLHLPIDKEASFVIKRALQTTEPVAYTPNSEAPIPKNISKEFHVQSQLLFTLKPLTGKPWILGMHQCSYTREWKIDERKLFQKIGWRVTDGLNSMLFFRNMKKSEENLRITLNSIGDGVIATDKEGKVTSMNPIAEQLTGWNVEEAKGKQLETIFHIVNAKTNKKANNPVNKVLKTGKIVGLANHTKLISKTGKEFQIADSGAPIRHPDGEIIGVVLVFRDVTEEYRMREALDKKILALTQPIEDNKSISFESLFNIDDIQKLQDQFSNATGVASIIVDPEGKPITNPSNFCRLCQDIIRKTKKGLKNCYKSDAEIGGYNPDGPIIQPCKSGGLWDAGASIAIAGKHIASWLVGQVRNEKQDERELKNYAKEIGVDEKEFMDAYYEVPEMTEERFKTISNTLYSFANQLSQIAYQNVQQARFISEKKKTEKQLVQNEKALEMAQKIAHLGSWEMDIKTGKTKWSDEFFRICGFKPQAFKPTREKGFELIHPDDKDKAAKAVEEAIKNKSKYHIEKRIVRPSGAIRWVLSQGDILTNDKDEPITLVGSFLDITERKMQENQVKEKNFELQAAEEELSAAFDELKSTYAKLEEEKSKLEIAKTIAEENEARFRELTELLPETVYELDNNFKLNFINKSGLNKFQFSRTDFKKGINIFDCFIPGDHERIKKSIKQNLKGIKISGNTYTAVKKDGSTFPVLIHSNTIRKENKITGLRGILIDISELRKSEKLKNEVRIAERTAKLKEQFLANMSHEMRTPMTGIIGMTEFLMDTNLNNQQEEYVNVIRNSSESLLFLINDILDISKIEQGKMGLIPETIDITSTLNNVVNIFSGPIKQKNLNLVTEYDKNFPNFISIDENRFKQVVSNLLSNAVKYTKSGSIKVKLIAKSIENDIVSGKINVIDTGIGINQENLDRIFEMFSRVDDSYTRKTEGSGLGLHISKQLAKLMDGDLGVESIEGKGSNFWFTFKAEIKKDVKKEKVHEKLDDDEIRSLNLNIMLAEDKLVNQQVISMMLQNAGCHVTIANNGKEVIEKFQENTYDIIFMDIMMPELDGIAAMKKLRKEHSNLPPVIGLSAHAMQGDAEKFINLGMDDYIEKPVKKETLLRKLKKWA